MHRKELFIRVVVYVLLIVGAFALVRMKQSAIIRDREQTVVSIVNEWDAHGKPVRVATVQRSDFYVFTKVTAERIDESALFVSYVSQDVFERLRAGQQVCVAPDIKTVCGTISAIPGGRDLDTGLFKISLDLSAEIEKRNHREILFIHTGTEPAVLQVSHDAIDLIDRQPTVRLVVDGKVVVRTVSVGALGQNAIVITEGVAEGDQVIVEGKTLVRDGDRVSLQEEMGV